MKSVWNEHPAAISKTFINFPDELFIILEGAGNGHALHVACGEGVDKSFLLVDRIAESACNKIGKTNPEGIALSLCRKSEGSDDLDFRLCQVLISVNPPPSDHIGIHASTAIRFSNFIDDEDIQILAWESRKVVAVPCE